MANLGKNFYQFV